GPAFRAMMLGMILIESSTIIALIISVLLFFNGTVITWNSALADLAAALSVGVASLVVCVASSFTVKAAVQAIGRQPFFAQKILTLMLIAQSIIEAIAFFAFVVAVLIKARIVDTITLQESIRCCTAGLAILLGCVGPAIGQAFFTSSVCTSVGENKDSYGKIFSFTIFGVAFIEAAMIFCLLFALLILFAALPGEISPMLLVRFAIGAVTMGIGSCATAIALGRVFSSSARAIATEPDSYAQLLRPTLITAVFIESIIIYALIVGLLIFKI
ncbi:MAG: ATP synthase F0 subunit C, partial [Candidatus Babeliales bacterium]